MAPDGSKNQTAWLDALAGCVEGLDVGERRDEKTPPADTGGILETTAVLESGYKTDGRVPARFGA